MFDTHCHLNFQCFAGKEKEVIDRAKTAGVNYFLVPGTDKQSSRKAVEIAQKYDGVYAAVGIHPHHVYESQKSNVKSQNCISNLKMLLQQEKVVAVGEVGLDRHVYKNTKYDGYAVEETFIESQKVYLQEQINLALEYDKSLILHNREAKDDFLAVLKDKWDKKLVGRTVFHCCEPDEELLQFAIDHKIYIGVDGDVTYDPKKQAFVKKIPLDLLVLETDSPYLLPEPLRSQKLFPNEPKNIPLIAEFISKLKHTSINQLIEVTTNNAKRLFNLMRG